MTGRWERLDAALAYARTGWPVFPCRPGTKEPATRNGFYDATTNERQIRQWWHKEPGRNVAIATGAPGPDVVDVDNHGEHDNGFGTLNHLKREGLVDGYHAVVQTPSGGFHLYYRGSEQASGSARGYRIDFRSKGGYVVAPPSARPEGAYVVAKHAPAAEAGTVSWDAIRAELNPPQPQRLQRQAAAPYPQGDTVASMDRLVNWAAQGGPGDRNFRLFWAAKQAELIGGLTGPGVERLVDALGRADPGVNREREARRTIESGRQAAQAEADEASAASPARSRALSPTGPAPRRPAVSPRTRQWWLSTKPRRCDMAAEDLGLLPDLTGSLPPLLVTASRDGLTEADVESALRPHFSPARTLISGNARGGDRIAEELWERWGGDVDRNPIDPQAWQQSRGAGYQRDAAMVAKGRQLGGECVAVIARCTKAECAGASPHGSHGAVNTARMAAAAGMPVDRIKAGSRSQGSPAAEPETKRHGRHYPPEMELPEGICPGCRSATLTSGREACQACGMAESYSAAPGAYADVSHGQPGHMCVLPEREREAEAGS